VDESLLQILVLGGALVIGLVGGVRAISMLWPSSSRRAISTCPARIIV
jgi:hypothetical protein